MHDSPDQPRRMQVVATRLVAEHIGPLIEAFRARDEGLEIAVESVPGASVRRAARAPAGRHRARPAPGPERAATIASAPFLRCRLIVVAAPDHPLAGRAAIAPADARGQAVARRAARRSTRRRATGLFLGAQRGRRRATSRPTAARRRRSRRRPPGEGVVLTLAHSVVDEVRRRALVRLDVRGTPVVELWHASTLGLGRARCRPRWRCSGSRRRSDATQAISLGSRGRGLRAGAPEGARDAVALRCRRDRRGREAECEITLSVNGEEHTRDVEPRLLLVHFLRDELGLTGTHWGCDTSNCGVCVVLMDGEPVKSCTVLAATAASLRDHDGRGTGRDGVLDPVQQGFHEEHGLQCGFCTSGMMLTARALLDRNPDPTDHEIRAAISGPDLPLHGLRDDRAVDPVGGGAPGRRGGRRGLSRKVPGPPWRRARARRSRGHRRRGNQGAGKLRRSIKPNPQARMSADPAIAPQPRTRLVDCSP